jgi:hypothetical protein
MEQPGNGMKHLDERTLALYILKAPEVKDQRTAIAKHLRACKGCAALRDEISEYYTEFQTMHESQNSTTLPVLMPEQALQSFFVRQGVVMPAPRPGLLQQFVHSFRRYPVRWSTGFATVIAGLVLLTTTFKTGDSNPAYARAKEEFLVVYNKQGKELWRKHAGIGFDLEYIARNTPYESVDNFVRAVDVDNDGANEVIAVFGLLSQPIAEGKNVVTCYGSDGSARWKYPFHRKMTFGNEAFSDDYHLTKIMVEDFDNDGRVEVIATATHSPYYPTAIIRLDAQRGVFQSEYWNSGLLAASHQADLDGDGIVELLFGGTNNGYNQAALVVLDPRAIDGHSPAPSAYLPVGIPTGREKYYLLFPKSDLLSVSTEKRNRISSIRLTSEGLLEVRSLEVGEGGRFPKELHYYFDSAMRCVRVTATDYFEEAHRKLEAEGKLTTKLSEQYFEELRQGIRYWDGEKFVKEAVKSGRYEIAGK